MLLRREGQAYYAAVSQGSSLETVIAQYYGMPTVAGLDEWDAACGDLIQAGAGTSRVVTRICSLLVVPFLLFAAGIFHPTVILSDRGTIVWRYVALVGGTTGAALYYARKKYVNVQCRCC